MKTQSPPSAPNKLTYHLCCKFTGLQIGELSYITVAGHMPYLSHWDNMVCLHPIFSLDRNRLLAFARSEWNRLAKASEDGETTEAENHLLQVCFLVVLHSLESIHQECPALPPLHIVQNNMPRLFALSYWHYYLNSKRFTFPEFKINKLNATDRFENIHHYLSACFAVKEDYEAGISEVIEAEKVAAADRALKALRNSWIVPVGRKQLWRWVRAHLPERFSADAQGWMSTLFLGNERTILDFDKDEVQLLEEIVLSECPPGTGILKAVRDRIDEIMQVHIDNKEAFTVDFEEYETGPVNTQDLVEQSEAEFKRVAPKPEDFATKALYIKANALFYLQTRAREQQIARLQAGEL